MNGLLRPRIWQSSRASSGVPSAGSGQAHTATYRSGTPRIQHPVVARWHDHLHGLATAIHETFGLESSIRSFGPTITWREKNVISGDSASRD